MVYIFLLIILRLLVWGEDLRENVPCVQNIKIVKFILYLNSITEDETALYI